MIGPILIFGLVVFAALLAAMRPQIFARYFLGKWQRERLAGNMNTISWSGWVIFGLAVFAAIRVFIAALQR
jgi:hypothetical protein